MTSSESPSSSGEKARLSSDIDQNIKLVLEDSRRLTGPNFFGAFTGAIVDVEVKNSDIDHVISIWQKHIRVLLNAIGWENEKSISRKYKDGASLVISAPIDLLYAATEVNEAAWQLTVDEIKEAPTTDMEKTVGQLITEINKESNPRLLAIHEAALQHDVVFLSDDDEVSLGYGASCQTYPIDAIPAVEDIQ